MTLPQLSEWAGTHVLVFGQLQIKNHAKYLGVEIGPDADHRWTKAINKFVCVCAYPHLIAKPCVGVHAASKLMLTAFQITSKAARSRVASQFASLTTRMERVRAAKDHVGRTLESVTRSWDEKYLHSSTAFDTTAAI